MKGIKKYTFKTLAIFLSILMIIYLVPTFVFAEWIDELTPDTSGENTEATERASEIYEMTERREESVKHFHCSDGTNVAVQYDMPVHYLDGDEWKDIDNTLSASGSEYSTGDARIKFAKKITGNESLFTLHDGNSKIVMSLDGAEKKTTGTVTNQNTEYGSTATQLQKLMTLDKLSSKIVYSNILDGVDLEYIVFSSNVKENIIVKKKLSSYQYTFTISLNNLYAMLLDDGSVNIFDSATNEITYVIPKGYMVDDSGVRSDTVEYSLTDLGNGKYRLVVTADAEWINDEGRTFPVRIDPSVNVNPGNSVDVDLDSDNPYDSSADDTIICAGGTWHIYWKNTSLPTIPEYSYITDAKLSLYCTYYNSSYLGVYKVTGSWDDSLVWNDIDESSAGTVDSTLLDYNNITDSESDNGRFSWTITDLVRAWYDGSVSNNGVCLQDIENNSSEESANFTSSDSSAVNERPRLIITYKDQLGLENYWSFISQSAGGAGTGSINLANGNLVFSIGTLTTTDNLMPYTPTLIYNSMLTKWLYTKWSRTVPYLNATTAGGFKTNMNQCIVPFSYINESGASDTFYVYTDADGTEHAFYRSTASDESNIYYDEDGLKLKLTVNTSDYEIIDSAYNKYTFAKQTTATSAMDVGGYLTQIEDVNGNKLSFNCNQYGRPQYVKMTPKNGSAITQLEINYSSNNSTVIAYILNPTSQQAVLLYYSSDYNTSITSNDYRYLRKVVVAHYEGSSVGSWSTYYKNGSATGITADAVYNYDYDSVGHMTSVIDNLQGRKLEYTYDSGERVTSVKEFGKSGSSWIEGQSLNITYGTGFTQVETSGEDDNISTTADNIITRYVFDSEGRCVTCYSSDSTVNNIYGMSTGEYESENEKAKNSLKISSVVSDIATNYLINANFENVTSGKPTGWSTTGSVASQTTNSFNKNPFDSDYTVRMTASANSPATLYQSVYLLPGTYTLSADVMRFSSSGVTVQLKATTLSGGQTDTETFHFRQEYQTGETAEASLTFDITTAGTYTMKLIVSGSSYVDVSHMTLSKSTGVSTFSRVQNGSFELYNSSNVPTYWTPYLSTSLSVIDCSDAPDGYSLRINGGGVGWQTYAEQTIFEASAADKSTFTSSPYTVTSKQYRVSGRAKASSALANPASTFGIRVIIKYVDESGAAQYDDVLIPFNKYTSAWQFASGIVTTRAGKYFVESIKVRCEYSRQTGTSYFDDISVCYVGSDPSVTECAYYEENGMPQVVHSGQSYTWYKYDGYNVKTVINRHSVTEYVYQNNVVWKQYYYKFLGDVTKEFCGYPDPSKTVLSSTAVYSRNTYGQIIEYRVDSQANGSTKQENSYNTTSGSHIFGALTSTTNDRGEPIRYFYDSSTGQLKASIGPDGNGLTYSYDAVGRLINACPAETTSTSYTETTDSANVSYAYDTFSRLSTITTESTTYTFTYDAFGNSSQIKAGNNTLASYEYNAKNGKLSYLHYGNGLNVKYDYDSIDRVERISYNTTGSSSYTDAYVYSYDSNGNLCKIDDKLSGQVTTFNYDSQGRLCSYFVNDSESELDQSALYYSYDDESRIKEQHYIRDYNYSGSVYTLTAVSGVSYDVNDGTISSYDSRIGYYLISVGYTHDDLMRLSGVEYSIGTEDEDYPNTVTQTYDYLTYTDVADDEYESHLISSVTTVFPQNGGTETLNYTYDSNGNITEIRRGTTILCRYEYDALGQLVREDNSDLGKTYVWDYDAAGNILSKKTYAYTTGTLGSAPSTISYGYGNSAWGDLLTSYYGNTITYDAIGNPLSWGDYGELTWQGRRLESYTDSESEETFTYTYNSDGIRTSKTIDGVEHIYHLAGTQILSEEWTENGVQHLLIYIYDASGAPIGMAYRDSTYVSGDFDIYLFAKNIQGDILYIYNTSGTRLVTYTYDAWGNVTTSYSNGGASTAARYNPFRYRGYYYDTETGFYYLNSRYYDPAVGRFLNADGQLNTGLLGYNLFAYCYNNPVMYVDPNGESLIGILLLIATGIGLVATLSSCSSSSHVIVSGNADPELINELVPGGNDSFEEAFETAVSQLSEYTNDNKESGGYIYEINEKFFFSNVQQINATDQKCTIDFSGAPYGSTIHATIHTHLIHKDYGEAMFGPSELKFARENSLNVYVVDPCGCIFVLYPTARDYDDYHQIK